ncbi:MAG: GYD domain-containing protein [Candidatus Dormibacter sp.]
MPKYLVEASYTAEGLKGILKEGGSSRRSVVEGAAKALGGSVESFYYVFGEDDVVVVLDLPDNTAAAAFSLAVSASGNVTSGIRVLLTPEEIDKAAKQTVQYRAPGG